MPGFEKGDTRMVQIPRGNSKARRLLALVLALTVLLSCAAVYTVAAASAQAYHYTFDSASAEAAYFSSYWGQTSNAANNTGFSGAYARVQAGSGYAGADHFMELSYQKNLTETKEGQNYAVFSLPNNTGETKDDRPAGSTIHLLQNQFYKVTVVYKTVSYVSSAKLQLAVNMGNLTWYGDNNYDYSRVNYPGTLAAITGASADWETAVAYYRSPIKQGAYIVLKMDDDTKRSGTVVQIGRIDIEPCDTGITTISFDSDGGTEVGAIYGEAGTPIVYPPAPTRSGFQFVGWSVAGSGDPAPTVFPNSDITLKANWTQTKPLRQVSFYTNGGTAVKAVSGAQGDPLPAGLVSEKEGFIFQGWFLDYACTQPATVFPDADAVLYAGWCLDTGYVQSFETVGSGTGLTRLYECDFDTAAVKNYYNGMSGVYHSNRTEYTNYGVTVKLADDGETHSGATAMRLAYTLPANSMEAKYLGAFRITGQEGERITVSGRKAYRVSFWYKVQELPQGAAGTLCIYSGSVNWSGYVNNSGDQTVIAEAARFTGTGAWQQAEVYLHGSAYPNSGLHMVMEMDSPTNREGTVVLVDDLVIEEVSYTAITANGDAAVTEEQAHTGTKSVRLTATAGAAADANRVVYADQSLNAELETGKKYIATAWMYSPVAFSGSLRLIGDPDPQDWRQGFTIAELPVSIEAGHWVRISHTFTPAAGSAAKLYVSFGALGSGTVYLDDLLVTHYSIGPNRLQDFEGFAPGTAPGTGTVDGTLHGNAAGRTVTDEKNATVNGQKSLKLTMNSAQAGAYARTVLFFGEEDFAAENGQSYLLLFNAMTTETLDVTLAAGSTETLDLSRSVTDMEANATRRISMQADVWQSCCLLVKKVTGSYITLGGWFDEAAAGNAKALYIDDVQLLPYTVPTAETYANNALTFDEEGVLPGTEVGLPTTGGTITVAVGQNHSVNGNFSALVRAAANGGGERAQMLVRTGTGEQVRIEQGKNYRVTFWVYIPKNALSNKVRFWLAADETDTAFADSAQKDAAKLYETADVAITPESWKQFEVNIVDAPVGGRLRLGMASDQFGNTFYLDDIRVREYQIFAPDPSATVQSFELYNVEDADFVLRNDAWVSDAYAHTGKQSLACTVKSVSGTDRNQFYLVNPATGKPWEVAVGKAYTVSMWVYIPKNQGPDMTLNYWMLSTDRLQMVTDIAVVNAGEYYTGNTGGTFIRPDTWTQIQTTVEVKNGRYLQFGLTDLTGDTQGVVYYVDDIAVTETSMVTVSFDLNGGTGEVPSVRCFLGSTLAAPDGVDPYRAGYEFTGWYWDPAGTRPFVFGKDLITSAQVTLYAGWKQWEERKPEDKEYTTVWSEDRVWTGKAEYPLIPNGTVPELRQPLPLETPADDRTDTPPADAGVSSWLIILIVGAAVLFVGGGATAIALWKRGAKEGSTNA